MHCPHKSPHFLSIQETVSHSLAPDILQVSGSVCEIVLANQNMFINENKRKNVTLSARHLLSERASAEIESGCVMNVVYGNETVHSQTRPSSRSCRVAKRGCF